MSTAPTRPCVWARTPSQKPLSTLQVRITRPAPLALSEPGQQASTWGQRHPRSRENGAAFRQGMCQDSAYRAYNSGGRCGGCRWRGWHWRKRLKEILVSPGAGTGQGRAGKVGGGHEAGEGRAGNPGLFSSWSLAEDRLQVTSGFLLCGSKLSSWPAASKDKVCQASRLGFLGSGAICVCARLGGSIWPPE